MPLDGYLQILDKGNKAAIKGEALDKAFAGAIAITSFELDSQVDLGTKDLTTPQESRASFFTFSIEKDVDAATPFLFQAYAEFWSSTTTEGAEKNPNGGKFDKAKVTLRKPGGKFPVEYMTFEFEEIWVKSWELKTKEGDELPEEQVEFCCNACTIKYFPQRVDGSAGSMVPGAWDFRKIQSTGS
jgi:type VI protein secretion system component Hcp